MEMLIIGSACVLGHILNKDGKQSRAGKTNTVISPNRLPAGTVIYDSNRVADVDSYVRNLAAAKHAEKVRRMYPEDYDKPNNIFPNDLEGGRPTELMNLAGGADYNFTKNVNKGLATNINVAAYNPSNGQPFATTALNVDSSPMFAPSSVTSLAPMSPEFAGQISLLTGLPLDMTHANMNPMFGKTVKQAGVSNENSQVLLEKYTGMPSTDDQGTYVTKREVLNPLPSNPDNLQRANIGQVSDLYQRASWSVKPSHEFKTPIKAFKDLPIKDSARMMPASIDDVRGVNRKQVTYSGVLIPGQKGSTRPMLPNMKPNPWTLTTETGFKDLLPGRSVYQGSSITVVPNVRNMNSTEVYEGSYLAPATSSRKVTDLQSMTDMYKNQMTNSSAKLQEPFSPGYGGAKGTARGPNTGVYMMRDPEKGFANERQGQPYQGGAPRMRNVGSPDVTLKDILSENKVGAINPNGLKDNNAWKKQNVRLDVTNKAMNSNNLYRGLPGKNLGMGNRKHKIEQWTTNKETVQFTQNGNPKGLVPAHMSYDSVFEMDTNKEMDNDHVGIAKAPIMAKISDGGEIIPDEEKLMVSNYLPAPKGTSQGRNRKAFIDGTELDYEKLEFGGHYNGVKVGNGEDAKRSGQVQVKEEMIVEGRMNAPMKHDNPNDVMEMEANLRPEKETVERQTIQRVQPVADILERNPILTRTRNVEVINPRLDINTKVRLTSDPYPWIKEKDEE